MKEDQENQTTQSPNPPAGNGVNPNPDTNPAGEGVKPEAAKPKVVRRSSRSRSSKPVKPVDQSPATPTTPPVEEMVTLMAADPKTVLEASIGSRTWKGNKISVPKELEGEVRRLLEGAGMYLKN